MEGCSICGKGKIRLVRGRLQCTVCARRICGKCMQPIMKNESMGSNGRGDFHLGACPGTGAGIKIHVPRARGVMQDVNPGMR